MAADAYITVLYDDFVAAARALFSLGAAGMQPDEICVAMSRHEELMALCERIATVPIESAIAQQLQEAGIHPQRAEHCERRVQDGGVLLLLRLNGATEAINAALAESGGDLETHATPERPVVADEPEVPQPEPQPRPQLHVEVQVPAPAGGTPAATGAFVLCMQPMFELRSGSAIRAEALLRYDAPDRPLISWPEFDSCGALHTMATRWALAQLLQRATHWHAEHGIERVHLNVTLSDEVTLSSVVEALSSTDAGERALIAIEVGVTSRIERSALERALYAVRGLAVEAGIDLDEVTSANIPALYDLPFTFLKIPAEEAKYVPIETFPWDVYLTRVQSPLPWDNVRDRGVKFVQGFALEPPVTVADFEMQVKCGTFSRRNPTVVASP